MAIKVGDRIPDATLLRIGDAGPEAVSMEGLTKGRKVVIFAVPGAYTPTCDSAHVPSFIRTRDRYDAAGVDEIVCLSVNDPFVMKSWGESTGALDAGITMLADAGAEFTRAVGMDFTAEGAGFINRSVRYAMLVEDGVVKLLNIEEARGVCEVSGGEGLLADMAAL
ncbi:peroxiredoxin [Brevirhabdus pacifica]|uniref:Glutathione-dependent peroxiredoxin n=1 Tax=Brevirhabdus pacifica TaxID=1267768 RepID=A0A1U7DJ81_9RHOB|nr:peroxiredoxin [Brevirhabdus pacifica]APX90060.1 peroxiredoxin [Brevirhabdus pacifica]OWU75348.1 thiol peroxidase [Loktanella sp. 22II-4b]PJJ82688.1 thiol peroxidase (atypical 2-Cys peroxiredoxin) [Brevirhabdus pacifica]